MYMLLLLHIEFQQCDDCLLVSSGFKVTITSPSFVFLHLQVSEIAKSISPGGVY